VPPDLRKKYATGKLSASSAAARSGRTGRCYLVLRGNVLTVIPRVSYHPLFSTVGAPQSNSRSAAPLPFLKNQGNSGASR
jgi:hypothetical protein